MCSGVNKVPHGVFGPHNALNMIFFLKGGGIFCFNFQGWGKLKWSMWLFSNTLHSIFGWKPCWNSEITQLLGDNTVIFVVPWVNFRGGTILTQECNVASPLRPATCSEQQVDIQCLRRAGQCGLPSGLPTTLGPPLLPLFLATVLFAISGWGLVSQESMISCKSLLFLLLFFNSKISILAWV